MWASNWNRPVIIQILGTLDEEWCLTDPQHSLPQSLLFTLLRLELFTKCAPKAFNASNKGIRLVHCEALFLQWSFGFSFFNFSNKFNRFTLHSPLIWILKNSKWVQEFHYCNCINFCFEFNKFSLFHFFIIVWFILMDEQLFVFRFF